MKKEPIKLRFDPSFFEGSTITHMAEAMGISRDDLVDRFRVAAKIVEAQNHTDVDTAMRALGELIAGPSACEVEKVPPDDPGRKKVEEMTKGRVSGEGDLGCLMINTSSLKRSQKRAN